MGRKKNEVNREQKVCGTRVRGNRLFECQKLKACCANLFLAECPSHSWWEFLWRYSASERSVFIVWMAPDASSSPTADFPLRYFSKLLSILVTAFRNLCAHGSWSRAAAAMHAHVRVRSLLVTLIVHYYVNPAGHCLYMYRYDDSNHLFIDHINHLRVAEMHGPCPCPGPNTLQSS